MAKLVAIDGKIAAYSGKLVTDLAAHDVRLISYGDTLPPDAPSGGGAKLYYRYNSGSWKGPILIKPAPSVGNDCGGLTAVPHGWTVDIYFEAGIDDSYYYEVLRYNTPGNGGSGPWTPAAPDIIASDVINLGAVTDGITVDVEWDVI